VALVAGDTHATIVGEAMRIAERVVSKSNASELARRGVGTRPYWLRRAV
jgi:hypothetical protein